jgi:hypothetical protein
VYNTKNRVPFLQEIVPRHRYRIVYQHLISGYLYFIYKTMDESLPLD